MNLKLSPLTEEQQKALDQLNKRLNEAQAYWLAGFYQGRLHAGFTNGHALKPEILTSRVANQTTKKLTVLYGTHTGHSQSISNQLQAKASAAGIQAEVFPMDDFKTNQLPSIENLAVIVSTHGDGEPPSMAEDFYLFIAGKRAPKLASLNYSVFALGDKSYSHFCQTGIDIDQALAKTGAKELLPIAKTDVDYEEEAEQWINRITGLLASAPSAEAKITENKVTETVTAYSKKNPFAATVLDKVKITGRDSDKEVYHFELSLEGSGLKYEPGDSLGVYAGNPPELVQQIIEKTKLDAESKVNTATGEKSFREALEHHFEITRLTRDTIDKYARASGHAKLLRIAETESQADDLFYGYDLLDLLEEYPHPWNSESLTSVLRNLPPRLYSISSSQEAVADEVHITVSTVRYENKGRVRLGAASGYLSDRIEIDDKVSVFIEKNPSFKLPEDVQKPIIMIGAGTGVAPYRAFLQHREALQQKGNSWLFFGERRFHSDFLYQVEWQKLIAKGYLERLDIAFSRDKKEKVYVQHRILENQERLFQWLQNGAVLYLCGDMKHMAKDVQNALLEVIRAQGGMTEEKAQEYIKKLKKEKRFQIDVY
ncbi:MAG: sulfite reductase [NADPH] flavoprotein, alpha-component [Bacteroidetes bacterium GWF2_42_66]|nr:MAG: sulfite reductase [NADPH] flavoprotein, alpha-component [Bacteroidetes bacterium GWE2_42_39]OFY43824.1 MAG: sulfite reductase [NADPH] flavoprotein, alpha-component [Bacteroidetes bacterium GWF2_42_66]HBL76190.1 assimilatory sulfite reductase (NADPH) flavoprotein subunit [Prolixibacteraceae bacterium]HCU60428.1 assimilatory sulfite reductase (NADPH) flavoprotein subunit [Prolixibacteraceae bacterium]